MRLPLVRGLLITLVGIIVVISLIVGGYKLWLEIEHRRFVEYLASPLVLQEQTEVVISSGNTLTQSANQLAEANVISDASYFIQAMVKLEEDRNVKAGRYLVKPDISHQQLIDQLVSGDVLLEKFRLIEGTTYATVIANIKDTTTLTQNFENLSLEQIWQKIAPLSDKSPEGMLMPDTYLYEKSSSAQELLQDAHTRLITTLEQEWENRSDDLPYANAYEALIMASIIEKETGVAAERELVASVFVNRLRKGMRLQSDPTVIYGMGSNFDGNIRKADLQTDTEYNTYTRHGLPPTPIAMVSKAALKSALHPAESNYYYFVADNEGGHIFSKTLREHNNAVNKYQRNR